MQEVAAGKNILHKGTAWRSEPTWHTCKDARDGIPEQEETQRELGRVTAGPGRA